MINLLNTYSLSDIVIILIVSGVGVVGFIKTVEWGFGLLRRLFDKEHRVKTKEAALEDRLADIEAKGDITNQDVRKLTELMEFFADNLANLVDSDKDAIKAYLTDKHHYYKYGQGWIDDYNMDCIERRYVHYKKAGGNSFVDHLIEDLRALPNQDPRLDI